MAENEWSLCTGLGCQALNLERQRAKLEAQRDALSRDIEIQNRELNEHQSRWRIAERRLAEALGALDELFACKDMKANEGKTPEYLSRKARAWRRARAVAVPDSDTGEDL